jgi:hypothetical protein
VLTQEQIQVLEAIGADGKLPEWTVENDVNIGELVDSGHVQLRGFRFEESDHRTFGSGVVPFYALTRRGAAAIGLDPALLR